MKQILIVMEGGLIQGILGIPEDVEIVVRDYDVEACDLREYLDSGTLKVYDKALCTELVWEHEKTDDVWDAARSATLEDIQ